MLRGVELAAGSGDLDREKETDCGWCWLLLASPNVFPFVITLSSDSAEIVWFHGTKMNQIRPLCWAQHMSLDNGTGLDPPGTGLAAA
ncbi:hypothetical protein V6N13_062162 [Hibiscus sabdariffa]